MDKTIWRINDLVLDEYLTDKLDFFFIFGCTTTSVKQKMCVKMRSMETFSDRREGREHSAQEKQKEIIFKEV